jgi:hypothetical protein
MKNTLKKIIVSSAILSVLGTTALVSFGSSPERHVAYRYVWGVRGVTEWSGQYHYTRAWVEPVGSDSGRQWGDDLTKATAYGDAIFNTAHTRYGK